MTATMNPTALFQHYVQNVFKFPKEIKNDIVYCQRALKAHIKVHQMVLDVFKSQGNSNPSEKQRVTDELETQIYEINAEQQFLLLRLRRQIYDFHKTVERKGVLVIPNFINEIISSELVPLINDQNFLVYPISIQLRSTEEQLIEKYFEAKKNEAPSDYFEILDSDDEEESGQVKTDRRPSYKPISNNFTPIHSKVHNDNQQQKSLPNRLVKRKSLQMEQISAVKMTSTAHFVELDTKVVKGNSEISAITPNMTVSAMKTKRESTVEGIYPVGISVSKYANKKENDDALVSQNVKMSRLNLRQALKNAQSGNSLVKGTNVSTNQTDKKELLPLKKEEPSHERNLTSVVPLSSSSDDSNPERCLDPKQSSIPFPVEIIDNRLKPQDYGQEMFLRIFGLFTPEMQLQLQQRRSKRKRRTVQSNERSDYHYGHIEYTNYTPPDDKKKRKAFLLSPQVKRKQGRPPKIRNIEKSDDIISSRSGSSSPDEKLSCKECLKFGGILENCDTCKSYYHQSCHSTNEKSSYSKKTKTCPPCRRVVENETKQQHTLQKSADKLQHELKAQKTRNKGLQQRSEKFKNQMSALFKIIKAIKNDADCNMD